MHGRQVHVYDRGDFWEIVATNPTEKLTIKKDLVPDKHAAKQYAYASFAPAMNKLDYDRA